MSLPFDQLPSPSARADASCTGRRTERRAPHGLKTRATGFTLIELILVLAILAIVAAAIIPSLRVFGVGRSTNNLASLIVSLANYSRTQAVAEGRTYRLNLDPSSREIWLTADNNGSFEPPTSDLGKRFPAAEGVQLWSDVAARPPDGQYIEFHASGRTDPAKIRVTDKLGGTIEVACTSATELFRILSPEEAGR